MKVLTSFENFQITRNLTADFSGSSFNHTSNYLKDLLYFKHLCHCTDCNLLNTNLTDKINSIERKITQEKESSLTSSVPLSITQEISFIVGTFEQFHLNPELLSHIHQNCL